MAGRQWSVVGKSASTFRLVDLQTCRLVDLLQIHHFLRLIEISPFHLQEIDAGGEAVGGKCSVVVTRRMPLVGQYGGLAAGDVEKSDFNFTGNWDIVGDFEGIVEGIRVSRKVKGKR